LRRRAVLPTHSLINRTMPLVLALTGKREPRTGLEAKFSAFHAAACALLRGDGSPTAFTDMTANDQQITNLRRRIHVIIDLTCHEASVDVWMTLKDGRTAKRQIERAIGSRERPLSNDKINEKFRGQVEPVIGKEICAALIERAWAVSGMSNVGTIAQQSIPSSVRSDAASKSEIVARSTVLARESGGRANGSGSFVSELLLKESRMLGAPASDLTTALT
jgi:hypothetical protein